MRAAPQRCLRAGASVPRAPAAMVPRRAIAVAAPARPAPTPSFSFAPVASPFFFPSARTSSYFIPPTTLPQRPAVENFWLPTPAASPFSVPIPKNAPVTEVPVRSLRPLTPEAKLYRPQRRITSRSIC